ncbi:hypothetical protein OS493_032028 [Desmophyllum pertusum]|uniref:long-chain-fatty-acid--CoA ligase n=1 Tax=Desmophyllum pertusum TaxID=174260 RepID=A0A9W9YZJ7_9CNID|nr:hypothetical protein OS493_032028 [Desmophyllum pertusum]
MKALLEQCDKCPKLKNIVKIGPAVTDEEKALGEKVGIKVTCFKELEEIGKNHRHEKKPPKPDDVAVVCYTSGTTGNPKGAMITHKNAIAMLSGLVYLVEKCGITVSEDDVHMSYLPWRISDDIYIWWKSWIFGGNVRNILDDLQTLKPTVFISVPRVLNRVYDRVLKQVSSSSIKSFLFNMAMRSKKAELERNIVRNNSIWDYLVFRKIQNSLGGRVRFLISGSAPLRDDVMVFLRCALGCHVFEGYGQTETTAAATLQMIGDNTYGHVGPPLPCQT